MLTLAPKVQASRLALQQVAVHVMARRRYAVTGRFGLRPSPGGIATPAFGEAPEVLRTCGRLLVLERGSDAATVEVTTLRRAAEAAGVDLSDRAAREFSVGADTPPMVDPDQPLTLDDEALDLLADWYALGSVVIDVLVATVPAITAATSRQLWPEHFDLGGTVTLRRGDGAATPVRSNVGASPGDDDEPMPYLYVGPWEADRPGDAAYWNAPFGAVLRYEDLAGAPPTERRARGVAFLRRGLELLAG